MNDSNSGSKISSLTVIMVTENTQREVNLASLALVQ